MSKWPKYIYFLKDSAEKICKDIPDVSVVDTGKAFDSEGESYYFVRVKCPGSEWYNVREKLALGLLEDKFFSIRIWRVES